MIPPSVKKSYKSYAVTVRPRDGATLLHDNLLTEFARKYCDYYHIVSEKLETDRHLHAALFLKRGVSRSNFLLMVKRVFKMLDDDEKRVLNQGVRIMYNADFMDEYLDKDDDTEVIASNRPETHSLDAYWPPSAEQEKAKASQAVDKYYAKLEMYWNQHRGPGVEQTYENVCAFVSDMMNDKRVIRVISDDRKLKATARALQRYMTRAHYVVSLDPWET